MEDNKMTPKQLRFYLSGHMDLYHNNNGRSKLVQGDSASYYRRTWCKDLIICITSTRYL
jgi:hypothetical protein